jgi:hypothetical protein
MGRWKCRAGEFVSHCADDPAPWTSEHPVDEGSDEVRRRALAVRARDSNDVETEAGMSVNGGGREGQRGRHVFDAKHRNTLGRDSVAIEQDGDGTAGARFFHEVSPVCVRA